MIRELGAAVVVVAMLALGAGCTGADGPAPETPGPSVGATESSSESAQNVSKPLGSWDLSPGVPENTPEDLPIPRDRWIEDSSVPFDAEGGMIDFWVTPTEFEQILLDFKAAGWEFGERSANSRRTSLVGYTDELKRSVNIAFVEENDDLDSKLTITYVAALP